MFFCFESTHRVKQAGKVAMFPHLTRWKMHNVIKSITGEQITKNQFQTRNKISNSPICTAGVVHTNQSWMRKCTIGWLIIERRDLLFLLLILYPKQIRFIQIEKICRNSPRGCLISTAEQLSFSGPFLPVKSHIRKGRRGATVVWKTYNMLAQIESFGVNMLDNMDETAEYLDAHVNYEIKQEVANYICASWEQSQKTLPCLYCSWSR